MACWALLYLARFLQIDLLLISQMLCQNFIDVLSEEKILFISRNPQELVSVQAQAQLHDIFLAIGPQGVNLLQQFTGIMRNSMASAISDVFTLSLVIVMGAVVSTLFLKSSPVGRRSSESA